MTYNVRHAECSSLEAIASVVAPCQPDLLAVQELDRSSPRSGGADQPALLAAALGLGFAFARTTEFQGGDYGHALFSRWPILRREEIPLPSAEEPRILLVAEIAAPDGPLRVAAVHLGLDPGIRRRQVTAMAEELEGSPRTLLLGDLNETPGGEVHRRLAGAMRDCFAEAGLGEGLTYPAEAPRDRIDYVFRSPDLQAPAVAEVLPDRASDHLAVWVRW